MSIRYGSTEYAAAVGTLASQAGQAIKREKLINFALQEQQLAQQRQQMNMEFTLAKEKMSMQWELQKMQIASQNDFTREEAKRSKQLTEFDMKEAGLKKALSRGIISREQHDEELSSLARTQFGTGGSVEEEYRKKGEERRAAQKEKERLANMSPAERLLEGGMGDGTPGISTPKDVAEMERINPDTGFTEFTTFREDEQGNEYQTIRVVDPQGKVPTKYYGIDDKGERVEIVTKAQALAEQIRREAQKNGVSYDKGTWELIGESVANVVADVGKMPPVKYFKEKQEYEQQARGEAAAIKKYGSKEEADRQRLYPAKADRKSVV